MAKKLIKNINTEKAYEFGESFYGKVEIRKEKRYGSNSWTKEISGASFRFDTKAGVKKFIANLNEALKEWDKI